MRSLLVDIGEHSSLKAVRIKIAGLALSLDFWIEVVEPSNFALKTRNLHNFFVHELSSVFVNALLCHLDVSRQQLYGQLEDSLGRPGTSTENFQC